MFSPGGDENEWAENWQPPAAITRELFLAWREARRASFPVEEMTNPVWRWLIDTNITAFHANEHFKGPDQIMTGAGPGWCFNRYGRSFTQLPNGRSIIIAGEHEDHYDPDFFIYNDVVIVEPGGEIRILGYPTDHFPPTDFHSATLAGEEVLLVGNLSYPDLRRHGDTQVLALDLRTMTFQTVETSGDKPGWISNHEAQFDSDRGIFLIHGGMIDHGPDRGGYLKNFDSWQLDPRDWRWTRITRRTILRWEFHREDNSSSGIFGMRMTRLRSSLAQIQNDIPLSGVEAKHEALSSPNLELLENLYEPLVAHEAGADSTFNDRIHFIIEGISIRFDERFGDGGILMTVEGELPETLLADYVEVVCERLSKLENCSYHAERSKA